MSELVRDKYQRFLVFEYSAYCPTGGMSDCLESFSDFDEALRYAGKCRSHNDYIEIFDCAERRVVWEN